MSLDRSARFASHPSHAAARHHAADAFNSAWGPTMPAELDPPAPFEPRPVHGWASTRPAAPDLDLVPMTPRGFAPAAQWRPTPLDAGLTKPFRDALNGGLALREVDEPELFHHFFGSETTLTRR